MTPSDRNLDADRRAVAVPCPACLMPAVKPCHFANGEDPAQWVHAARGLAFWRRRTLSAAVEPS